MASVAAALKERGYNITGSDQGIYPPMSTFLKERDDDAAMKALDAIRDAARNDENVMPSLVDGALARCTLGEMVQAMADVFGRYSGGPEW